MSTAVLSASAAAAIPVARRTINPWIIALAVVIPTFMEVLDTTIANVALRYMAGGLSAPATDSEWVITSYLAANAIILPISGWLAVRLGRRNYFLLSIAIFTLASVLCGMASSLGMLIASRVLQGLAGGGLQPSSQGVLLDAFPPEKQGAAQTLFGIAALLAPVVGPTLGGYITDNYGWRWIFFLNLPVGGFALWMCSRLVFDPPYLKAAQIESRKKAAPFDTIGLCLLSLTMVTWEVVLSKGQEWDWFGDPFLRVQTLAVLFVVGLVGLIWREKRIANPLIHFRTLADQNFRWCCVIIFCAFASLYANTTSLPALLQSLFGYDATTSGLVLSPSGIGAVIMLFIVGLLLGRGMDARWLMAAGLFILAIGNFWMSRFTLDISPWDVVWSRTVFIVGLSMLFAPLNVAAFMHIPPQLRGAAVGLLALLRNEGGSVGTSIAQTIHERRDQFHSLRLGEHLDSFNPAVTSYLDQARAYFLQQNGDAAAARDMAIQSLQNLREQQSSSFAYFDTFVLFAAVSILLIGLTFFMKRSVAEKGAHVAAE
ncbi:drug resistance transporter, EmrB/QacA subfamily [Chthoniobacter flavus Ellin428]|uniref:Drug resistance transporter, EmrB/QacA subfamily n=1 Tax=Chthoniobacter flavus Ellin428 TaxID=497964 RepID=B4DAK9_9BACT|nr:DHA2 family efflux MFS transporter permease subunit [Chthoniobacter flavus]EDY16527.1 drug resistance transporter, EmrB/QacA subfamily [Chthoniobacter flavus Ellin428]TCO85215.1 DHA2 family multidrug resistance protein [Chthoniobacter flavus]